MNDLIDQMIARILPGNNDEKLHLFLRELFMSAQKGDLCTSINQNITIPPSLLACGNDEDPFPKHPLVLQKDRLYLQRNWALETLIVKHVKTLLQKIPQEVLRKEEFFKNLEKMSSRLSSSQEQAIKDGFGKNLAIFAGGPGTGKTYTAAAFIRLLADMHPHYRVAIGAPTGKAASRLEEVLFANDSPKSLVCKTATLHRLLSLRPKTHRIGSPKKLDFDLIVIDEASMLDHFLMVHLLDAIPSSCRLLLLGDANQLPPIESGSLFSEMASLIGSKLTQSHRMEKSSLEELASHICLEDAEKTICQLKRDGNWIDWDKISTEKLADWLKPEGRRILSPLRKGPFGVDSLNRDLKFLLNWKSIPILIKQNDPKNRLWNGMSGVIVDGVAHFKDETFPVGMLPPYEEAFCISIHKSQGSEYDEVLVLFPPGSEGFGKEALYTAVTRAKKRVIIASTEEIIRSALAPKERKRSGFLERVTL